MISNTKNRFSYAELRSEVLKKANLMQRDADAFAEQGIAPEVADQLRQRAETLMEQTMDKESVQQSREATAHKNSLATDLHNRAAQLQLKARIAFGRRSANYRDFVVPVRLNNEKLVHAMHTVLRFAEVQKAYLSDYNLTDEWIAASYDLLTEYEQALLAQDTAIKQRDMATQARHLIANALFADLIRYAAIGRMIWSKTDTAKANDYRFPVHRRSQPAPEIAEAA